MGETWSRGTNSRLPFGVNVNLNLSTEEVKTALVSVPASTSSKLMASSNL